MKEIGIGVKEILNNIGDGILFLDRDYKIIFANRAVVQQYRQKEEDVIGRECHDFIYQSPIPCHKKDPSIICTLHEVFRTGKTMSITHIHVLSDGTEKIFDIIASPITNEKGDVVQMLKIVRDVTEKRRVEDVVHESEEKYRAFFEQAADSIVLIDTETGALVEFNNKACENLGYNRKEFQKFKIPDFEVIESAEEVSEHIKKIIKKGADVFETKHRRKDGQIRDILVSSRAISVGGRNFIQSIWCDITERKQVEEALQESETNLKKAQEIAKLGCWSWDRHKDRGYWSDQTFRILGYNVNEIQLSFKWLLEIMHHDDVEPAMNGIEESLKTGKSYDMEYRLTRKDGKEITVHSQAEVIFNERGEATKMMGVIQDITERKKVEQQLKDSESKLHRQKLALEKKNIALREIIKQIDVEKNKLKEDISININKILLPIISKLKNGENSRSYIELLGYHLEELLSSFGRKVTDGNYNLTSRELEICNMIKGGLRSKEISNLLHISYETVEKHRRNIRKKMGISKEKVNLYYLLQRF